MAIDTEIEFENRIDTAIKSLKDAYQKRIDDLETKLAQCESNAKHWVNEKTNMIGQINSLAETLKETETELKSGKASYKKIINQLNGSLDESNEEISRLYQKASLPESVGEFGFW